jgi:hypothetical protein
MSPPTTTFARNPTGARDAAAKIEAGIDGSRPFDVEVRGVWWRFVFAVVLLAMSISLARSALDGVGRFRLEIVRDGSALVLRRSVFGLPVAWSEVALGGVVDVEVERADRDDFWRSRAEAPTPAGRIILRDRFGAGRPVTDRFYPGRAVHLSAAAALRAILGLMRRPGGVEEVLAALPLVTTSLGMRVTLSWLGLTCGLLVGLCAYGVIGLALGLLRGRDGPDGWASGVGAGGGAIGGVLLVLYLTRPRRPR